MKSTALRMILPALLPVLLFAVPSFAALTPQQELGKTLYFDQYLSANANQACASCHSPPHFVDPANVADPANAVVSQGSILTEFGGRNAPSAAYAAFSPFFHWDAVQGLYFGGQFWDGRAGTLTDQALGPFLNPVEMALGSPLEVLQNLIAHPTAGPNPNAAFYQAQFAAVYAVDLAAVVAAGDPVAVDAVYEMLGEAIAAFEKSYEVNAFTSKFDAWLAGAYQMTKDEMKGMKLFNGKAQCNLCHPSATGLAVDGMTPTPPLFTDFSYDNLGIPANPLLAGNPVDYGLGGRPDIAANDPNGLQLGKFKVMTLRNIALTPPYGHNGFFATLEEIVHFYNTAAVPGLWPPPEVPQNVNRLELGDLKLTPEQELQIVAFLRTLSDGFLPVPMAPAFPFPPFP